MTEQTAPSALDSQLDAQVAAFAANSNLGRPVATYRPRRWGTVRLITLLVFGVVSLVIIVGFMFLWQAFRTPNLNKKLAAKRVYLFEYGFVTVDGTGPLEVYRWDAIHTVFQEITDRYANGVKVATTYKYTVNRVTAPPSRSPSSTRTSLASAGTSANRSPTCTCPPCRTRSPRVNRCPSATSRSAPQG